MQNHETVVALMYDFDKTLCTRDMQEYTFIPNVGLSAAQFWAESNTRAKSIKMDRVLSYMYLMLEKAKTANISITREYFVQLGKSLEYYPGVQEWFEQINHFGSEMRVKIEHYIISSGLKEIIEGSSIGKYFNDIFACEFYYDDQTSAAVWPKNVINYTTKTQFLFRINKGITDISNDDDLNKYTPEDERRVPFRNMIYIGDGLTDVPCMKLVKVNGGFSIAVYKEGEKAKVNDLLEHKRVDFLSLADYSISSELNQIVKFIIMKMGIEDELRKKSKEQITEVRRIFEEYQDPL